MNPELQRQIEGLQREIDLLKAAASIPFDVEQAFRTRLDIDTFNAPTVSSKGATTENKSVNEAGASTYSVLNPPDGFLQITLSGTTYYIPIFT